MTETTNRDLFPGALEMMILEPLRRQPAHGYRIATSELRHPEQQISSFERMFEGIALVLNPGKSPAS